MGRRVSVRVLPSHFNPTYITTDKKGVKEFTGKLLKNKEYGNMKFQRSIDKGYEDNIVYNTESMVMLVVEDDKLSKELKGDLGLSDMGIIIEIDTGEKRVIRGWVNRDEVDSDNKFIAVYDFDTTRINILNKRYIFSYE